MRLRRTVGPSLRSLFAHKVRATLALSSVSVGVAAVIVTSAISTGAQQEVVEQIERMGTNLLVVRPVQAKRLVARPAVGGFVTSLEMEDSAAIAALPHVAHAAPSVESPVRVKLGRSATIATLRGTTPALFAIRAFRLRAGRFLEADDDRAARRVAVLAARVAETLFQDVDAIGREIRIRGVPFEVIGVLEAKGVLADGSDDDGQVIVPIRTALRRVFNATWLSAVFVSVGDSQKMDDAAASIVTLLRGRHSAGRNGKPDDFAVQNTTRSLAIQRMAAESLDLVALGLGALTLVLGGTGVLGLMWMSVKERTGEIGLRMAVGATPLDVLVQFLVEATLVALAGWVAGLAIGAASVAVVAFGTEWMLGMPLPALLASFAMAVIIGLGFGSLPARKASRLPPIEALVAD
jgi:putative ABC transport system permease protein